MLFIGNTKANKTLLLSSRISQSSKKNTEVKQIVNCNFDFAQVKVQMFLLNLNLT